MKLENNLRAQKKPHFGRISLNLIKVTLYLLAPGDILRYNKDTGFINLKHESSFETGNEQLPLDFYPTANRFSFDILS